MSVELKGDFFAKIFEMYFHFIISGEWEGRERKGFYRERRSQKVILGKEDNRRDNRRERKKNPIKGWCPPYPHTTPLSHRVQHCVPNVGLNVGTHILV